MAEGDFAVTYDGPAVADGRMPVRDLAPALLALGEIFTDASLLIYPDRPPVSLDIKATKDGSFLVDLILEAHGREWDQVIDIFSGDEVDAIANLKELVIGPAAVGLFALIKRIRRRRIVKEEPSGRNPGQVRLTLDDETTFEVSTEAAALYRNVRIRKKAREVVDPLKRKGVESLEFRTETETTVELTREDVSDFEPPEGEEDQLLDQELELVLEIVAVAFTEGNKWRFNDGDQTFYARVVDEGFLERIELGMEAFRKGDMLRCRVQVIQSRTDGHLTSERRIVRVIEHIASGEQLPLEPGDDPLAGGASE